MSEMKHTPEPWRDDGWHVTAGDSYVGYLQDFSEDDRARIVVCVNALEGIPNEDLEGWPGTMGQKALAQEAELTRLRGEVERLTARAETAEAQVAELRARVRPSVEEIAEAVDREVDLIASDRNAIAKTIHDILPPVPKVLTVEECKALAIELQIISEQISSTAPDKFKSREEAEEWYEKTKGLEVEAHAQAIHKAMGGEE